MMHTHIEIHPVAFKCLVYVLQYCGLMYDNVLVHILIVAAPGPPLTVKYDLANAPSPSANSLCKFHIHAHTQIDVMFIVLHIELMYNNVLVHILIVAAPGPPLTVKYDLANAPSPSANSLCKFHIHAPTHINVMFIVLHTHRHTHK